MIASQGGSSWSFSSVSVRVFGATVLAECEARKADEEHGRALRRARAIELAFIHATGA